MLGVAANAINPAAKTSLAAGETFPMTNSCSRPAGAYAIYRYSAVNSGTHYLRTLDDANAIEATLGEGANLGCRRVALLDLKWRQARGAGAR